MVILWNGDVTACCGDPEGQMVYGNINDTPLEELWLNNPKLNKWRKELKKNKPELWGILSFADATEGHLGIIYQATNALYLGTSSPATFYIDQTGRLRHPRQNGVNITRQMAEQNGWSPVKREGKHRYLYILPDSKTHKKQLLKSIKSPQFPYPKVKG